jgi:DNA polymerase I
VFDSDPDADGAAFRPSILNFGMIQSVLIIDGTAVAYRAFYAVRELSTRDGRPTNALFGFIRMLRQLEAHWRPDRLVVAFDGGSPAHRLEKCPAYKAQRAPMPDDLRGQLALINEFLAAAGIPTILLKGQEADDVMATLAARAAAEGATVRLATSDKDLMQLVNGRVRLVPPTKTDAELDAAGVEAKTGVKPAQIVDWLALIGDTADNIPGVNGIGPKTATKLLAQFGSLAACFAHAEKIESDSVREKLRAGRAIAETNVALMTLDQNVPGVPGWPEIPAPAPDAAKLKAFFQKYELHRFAGELDKPPVPAAPANPNPGPAAGQMNLF